MTLQKGVILENRYRIDKLLAEGGMGAVYRGYDTKLDNRAVAIKENFFSTRERKVTQFKKEANLLARLHHAALPRVIDHFTHNDSQYLVMDFIAGQDLGQILNNRSEPLPERQAIDYIIQVCEAVKYLHSQNPPVIHRDIKPNNIKITPEGRVVLVDLGLAKVGGEEASTSVGARGLTPGYAPPEQYGKNAARTGAVSDIYSLGATLYALLTRTHPPDSVELLAGVATFTPPQKINPQLSKQVARIIIWAMQLRREKRPQSVNELQRELEKIGRGSIKPVAPPAPPPVVMSPNQVEDKSSWVLTVIIIALLLAVIGFAGMYLDNQSKLQRVTARATADARATSARLPSTPRPPTSTPRPPTSTPRPPTSTPRPTLSISSTNRLDPKDATAYNNRGSAYHNKGEYDLAISDFNEAIRLVPKYATAYNNRGFAYISKGEYDRAISDFNEAIRLDPKDATAYNNRGLAYNSKGEYDRAIADYRKVIELDNDPEATRLAKSSLKRLGE